MKFYILVTDQAMKLKFSSYVNLPYINKLGSLKPNLTLKVKVKVTNFQNHV